MNEQAFNFALKTLDILEEINLVLAPQNPTPHMCEVGARLGGVDPFTAKKIYEIMLDASLEGRFET